MRVTVSSNPNSGAAYQVRYELIKGESLPLSYVMTPTSGNADVPSAAVLTIAASRGGTAIYSGACTVTDSTTSYTVALTVPAATLAAYSGRLYFSVEETHTDFTIKPVQGEIQIFDSVEVES